MNLTALEIISVVCSCIYLVLLSYRNIWCWGFGIAGSALGIAIMYRSGLYGQVVLHIYYTIVGIYGWWHWKQSGISELDVKEQKSKVHAGIIAMGIIFMLAVGWYFSNQVSHTAPYADAAITTFALMASLMQARRWLSSWVYWFIINAASMGLYFSQSLYGYTLLMLLYCMLCIRGYMSWKKSISATTVSASV